MTTQRGELIGTNRANRRSFANDRINVIQDQQT